MDAFSLSLAYGTLNFKKSEIFKLSIIVGIYHFIMPLLGMYVGSIIEELLFIPSKYILLIIFLIIGLNMIIDSFKVEKNIKKLSIIEMILFGLAVSIDSFSLGIGIKNITNNYYISSIIFSLVSFLFTYLGLILGNKINHLFGKYSTILGGLFLIIFGIYYVI